MQTSEQVPIAATTLPLDTSAPELGPETNATPAAAAASVKRNPKKCSHFHSDSSQCSERPVKIVGDCRYCNEKFCGKHRLPEAHLCPNLVSCKEAAMSKLSSKLLGEKTVATKI